MSFPIQKRFGMLTYPRTNNLPMATSRDFWPLCLVVNNYFWEMADELPLGVDSFQEY